MTPLADTADLETRTCFFVVFIR